MLQSVTFRLPFHRNLKELRSEPLVIRILSKNLAQAL
jgi:hypothetical protein